MHGGVDLVVCLRDDHGGNGSDDDDDEEKSWLTWRSVDIGRQLIEDLCLAHYQLGCKD
jgi:hypothetical protein